MTNLAEYYSFHYNCPINSKDLQTKPEFIKKLQLLVQCVNKMLSAMPLSPKNLKENPDLFREKKYFTNGLP